MDRRRDIVYVMVAQQLVHSRLRAKSPPLTSDNSATGVVRVVHRLSRVRYFSRISRGNSGRHGTSASGEVPTDAVPRGDRRFDAMATLHIEHAISDYTTWKTTFDRFAPVREKAGIRQHRIQRPIDNGNYVVIDLDFESAQQARAFLDLLQTTVWTSSENAPALVGAPRTSILQPAEYP